MISAAVAGGYAVANKSGEEFYDAFVETINNPGTIEAASYTTDILNSLG